jgi:transposase/transposase IS116/IS110/IS902 family protein
VLFVGVDWAEDHHDLCVMAEDGTVLAKRRVPDSAAGIGELHGLIAEQVDDDQPVVVVGIEIDKGLVVWSLLAAGYEVYAINPMASARYRDRHATSGAKSDPGDAKVLADLVRTDRHNHRPIAGDSDLAEGVKVLARAHQNAIWSRQRQINALRSALREYYPGALAAFGTDLASTDALAVLSVAPTPELGRALSRSKIASALRRGGRQRNIERRAEEIQEALRADQLEAPELIVNAHGLVTRSALALIATFNAQIAELEAALSEHFEQHPDAKVVRSLPGLGTVLGARVLGEFGDDRTRFSDPKSRKNYAGTSPVTKASGHSRVVLARFARNRRLGDACDQWAFCALNTSPGARNYYDQLRDRGKTHRQALRQLANRLVGLLHICLERGILYDELVAWPEEPELAA